jgi:alpha/beta superfamily hydrolase
MLREFVGGTAAIVEIPNADHFFEGKLDALEEALYRFLASLPRPRPI